VPHRRDPLHRDHGWRQDHHRRVRRRGVWVCVSGGASGSGCGRSWGGGTGQGMPRQGAGGGACS
jgi:hypothetical protein